MKTFLSLTAFALVSVSIALQDATPVGAQNGPVVIKQCFVTKPKALSKNASGTQIVWTNAGTRPLSSVTFAVAYRNADQNLVRRVTDSGSFAPGATMDHHFQLFRDVVWAGTTTRGCRVLSYR